MAISCRRWWVLDPRIRGDDKVRCMRRFAQGQRAPNPLRRSSQTHAAEGKPNAAAEAHSHDTSYRAGCLNWDL